MDCEFRLANDIAKVKSESLWETSNGHDVLDQMSGFCHVVIIAKRGGLKTTILTDICFVSGRCATDAAVVLVCLLA